MRSFIAGIVVGILGLLTSILFENSKLANNSLLIIGIGSMILAAIFSGALASGDRVRANYSDEQDFRERMSWSLKLFLFGIPSLLASLAVYFIDK